MSKEITRRSFVKKSAAIGVGTVLCRPLIDDITLGNNPPDLAVVKGYNYSENTKKAVEILGGIRKFVPQHSKVALLPNPQSYNPGTHTKPEIVRAVIHMCKDAGADEIACLGWLPMRYWRNTGIKNVIDEEGANLVIADQSDQSQYRTIPVPTGKFIHEVEIMNKFFDYDVFITIPITKEHSGNNFSATMKNMMGINSPRSDQSFHKRDWTFLRDDIEYLEQCIVDLNTVIKLDLCVVDATEFVITNGPNGPGELRKPLKVIAGTDRVAIDTYCATLFDYNPKDISALRKAYEHGIGEMDLSRIRIEEISI